MRTHIIYRKELFLKTIIYIAVLSSLSLIALYILKSYKLAAILLIIMAIPILLLGILLNLFIKKMIIKLDDDHFTTLIINKSGKEFMAEFHLSELKSYSIQFPSDRFCSLRFKLKNGKSTEYSFFNKKQEENDDSTKEIMNNFHEFIKKYNRSNGETTAKIILLPSFYASNSGLCVIILLAVGFFSAVTWILLYKEKAVPFTFIYSLILIVQLLLKRSKELTYYKKQLEVI